MASLKWKRAFSANVCLFRKIAYNRVTYFKGRMCASPGGGCTVKEWSDNGDGSYTITPDLTDADGLSQFVDDILTTYFVTKTPKGKLRGVRGDEVPGDFCRLYSQDIRHDAEAGY